MRRIALITQVASIVFLWVFGSQVWAEATVTEQAKLIQISGLEAYPQLTIGMVVWLLIAFVSKYIKSLFGKFIISAASVLIVATMSPIWFESASGSMTILGPQISKLTGVSDWGSQVALISNENYNHLAADLFVILLVVCFASTLIRIWQRNGEKGAVPLTRIDQLPKW